MELWGTGDIRYVKPPLMNKDMIIDGFFQSEKYFAHHREEVKSLFSLKPSEFAKVVDAYAPFAHAKTCAISFRRGVDYYTSREMRILDMAYYKAAIERFDPDTLFVVFADNLDWCREHLHFIRNKVFVTLGDNVLDLHLMSMFRNNIIANSTFSWWGAWLGQEDKTVYMPSPSSNWFSDTYYSQNRHHGFQSLACKDWIIL